MSLAYIRKAYGVPAYRGARITFHDQHSPHAVLFHCTIKSALGQRLRVLVDDRVPGYRGRLLLHPTWRIGYHEGS